MIPTPADPRELVRRMRQFHDEIVASDGAESGQMFMMGEAADCIDRLTAALSEARAQVEELNKGESREWVKSDTLDRLQAREAAAREEERADCIRACVAEEQKQREIAGSQTTEEERQAIMGRVLGIIMATNAVRGRSNA